jgi:hypothetical protein
MPPVPNYGFEVDADDAGLTTIAEVEITGPSEVTLQINVQASSKVLKVRYAMDQPKVQGWAPGRGQLIAPTLTRSAFAARGMRVPEKSITTPFALRSRSNKVVRNACQ